MRRMWLSALAVTAAFSFGACAAGSDGTFPTADTGATGSDGGPGNQQPTTHPSEAGGTPVNPSPGDDSGQPGTSEDAPSGTGEDSATPPDDSGGPSEDSGTPSTLGNCTPGGSSSKSGPGGGLSFQAEWQLLTTDQLGVSCTSGSNSCPSANCCYVPASGAPLCVDE